MTEHPHIQPDDPDESEVKHAAKTVGKGLLYAVVVLVLLVLVTCVFLLGPIGLIVVVPAVLLIWFVAGMAAGGPAVGA